MKLVDIKKLETDKLHSKLADLRDKSRELRFSIANNQLKNVRELREVKQSIARVLTVLNQRRQETDNKVADKETK